MSVTVIRQRGPVWDKLQVALKGLSGLEGKVGWFDTARYPDGTPVALVAAVQEFGTAHIPPRSFMRTTVTEKQEEWRQIAAQGSRAILAGQLASRQLMEMIGAKASGDIAKKIASITTPPLKPATIRARQRRYANSKKTGNLTKPLVDTAVMINSVTWTVEEKK